MFFGWMAKASVVARLFNYLFRQVWQICSNSLDVYLIARIAPWRGLIGGCVTLKVAGDAGRGSVSII